MAVADVEKLNTNVDGNYVVVMERPPFWNLQVDLINP